MARPHMIVVAGPPGSGKTRYFPGGHSASEREIRAIYQASIANLGIAISAFDRVQVYDSTARWEAPRLVAAAWKGRVVRHGATPEWLEAALVERGD